MNKYVTISNLKQKTAEVIRDAESETEPIIVMRHSKPAAVILSPEVYREMEEALEELEDAQAVKEWLDNPGDATAASTVHRDLGLE